MDLQVNHHHIFFGGTKKVVDDGSNVDIPSPSRLPSGDVATYACGKLFYSRVKALDHVAWASEEDTVAADEKKTSKQLQSWAVTDGLNLEVFVITAQVRSNVVESESSNMSTHSKNNVCLASQCVFVVGAQMSFVTHLKEDDWSVEMCVTRAPAPASLALSLSLSPTHTCSPTPTPAPPHPCTHLSYTNTHTTLAHTETHTHHTTNVSHNWVKHSCLKSMDCTLSFG